jgi:hypothetical protein
MNRYNQINGRLFHVCVTKTNSTTHLIPYGIPNRAILCPALNNFFTADSPRSNECATAIFADDTAIFVSDKNPNVVRTALQGHILTSFNYSKQRKNKINALKTQLIYFTHCWSPRTLSSTNVCIGGHPISWSITEVKYLGVIFGKKLTFTTPLSLLYTLLIFEQEVETQRTQ